MQRFFQKRGGGLHRQARDAASRCPGQDCLLTVEHLSIGFDMYDPDAPYFTAGRVCAPVVRDLSLSVHAGEVVAVVGASGAGKTLLADAIMGLYEPNSWVEGAIWFDGKRQDAAGLARVRGKGISFVPQSIASLDPLMRVGEQIMGACPRAERGLRRSRMRRLLASYGLEPAVERMYPYELSGGMARRVLLLCALMDEPKLIVADEPTPGLDLPAAVHALDDLRRFAQGGGGVVLITHDIELALGAADRIAVFSDGTIVEQTACASFADPALLRHPFSKALWRAMPEHAFEGSKGHAGERGAR